MTSGVLACTRRYEQGIHSTESRTTGAARRARREARVLGRSSLRASRTRRELASSGGRAGGGGGGGRAARQRPQGGRGRGGRKSRGAQGVGGAVPLEKRRGAPGDERPQKKDQRAADGTPHTKKQPSNLPPPP